MADPDLLTPPYKNKNKIYTLKVTSFSFYNTPIGYSSFSPYFFDMTKLKDFYLRAFHFVKANSMH